MKNIKQIHSQKGNFKLSESRPYVFKKQDERKLGRPKRNPMFGPAKFQNNFQTNHFHGNPQGKKYTNSYPEKNNYQENESTLFPGFTIGK